MRPINRWSRVDPRDRFGCGLWVAILTVMGIALILMQLRGDTPPEPPPAPIPEWQEARCYFIEMRTRQAGRTYYGAGVWVERPEETYELWQCGDMLVRRWP